MNQAHLTASKTERPALQRQLAVIPEGDCSQSDDTSSSSDTSKENDPPKARRANLKLCIPSPDSDVLIEFDENASRRPLLRTSTTKISPDEFHPLAEALRQRDQRRPDWHQSSTAVGRSNTTARGVSNLCDRLKRELEIDSQQHSTFHRASSKPIPIPKNQNIRPLSLHAFEPIGGKDRVFKPISKPIKTTTVTQPPVKVLKPSPKSNADTIRESNSSDFPITQHQLAKTLDKEDITQCKTILEVLKFVCNSHTAHLEQFKGTEELIKQLAQPLVVCIQRQQQLAYTDNNNRLVIIRCDCDTILHWSIPNTVYARNGSSSVLKATCPCGKYLCLRI